MSIEIRRNIMVAIKPIQLRNNCREVCDIMLFINDEKETM
jgi:hypothetical protein